MILLAAGAVGCGPGWEGPPPGRSTDEPTSTGGTTPGTAPAGEAPVDGAALEPRDEMHEGELRDGDRVLETDGSLYDEYTFTAVRGASIVLVMRSEELEPYLHLLGPEGSQLAHGGAPPGESGVAELVLVAPQTASYRVYANALEPQMRGAYRLRIVVEPPPRGVATRPDAGR